MADRDRYDALVVGGGFFGCCLALFLRSRFDRVAIVESRDALLTRASQVNQARVHGGYHYPRSFVTALRSRALSARFARDFGDAVQSDFSMLYAISRRRSKVSTARFQRMFEDMGSLIARASPQEAALFNPDLIDGVFACTEFAFDWTILRDRLRDRLDRYGIALFTGETVAAVRFDVGHSVVALESGGELRGSMLFNTTYGGLNRLPMQCGMPPLPLKYELAEVALVEPPEELRGHAVTVMDGPFFSMMPFPAESLYSLTHVRYTPHLGWIDRPGGPSAYEVAEQHAPESRWRHMMMDARRYLPCAAGLTYRRSLYEAKTVLTRNERDDGRPILLHRHRTDPSFYSVMGGKIDNIYDLFDVLPQSDPALAGAHDGLLTGSA